MIALRDYQEEAIDAVETAVAAGDRRLLVGLPTGTGKTVVFSELARRRGEPTLILAHRDELLAQAADKYRMLDPAAAIGLVKAGANDTHAPIVVASVQTLARRSRLEKMPQHFRTVVVDEAHHATAKTYRAILDYFAGADLIVGVSATLERTDGAGLGHVFNRIAYSRTMREMIAAGWLVDIRAKAVRVSANFGALKVRHGDFVDSEVSAVLEQAGAPDVAARAYLEHAAGRSTIVFTPTVALAASMATAFRARGVAAEHVSGETPLDERRAILRRLHDGETQVVANAMVLTEGFDEPRVSCVVVARPTRSRPFYVQMVGRGTRLYPGKPDLLVLDLVGNTDRVDLVTVPRLFGLDPAKLERSGRGVVETIAHEEQHVRQRLAGGSLEAADVDLFERRRTLVWREDAGRHLLVLDRETVVALEPAGVEGDDVVTRERYLPTLYRRHLGASARESRGGVPLAEPLDLGYALGLAEAWAENVLERRESAPVLADPAAPWRKHPPSPKQVARLRKLKLAVPATKGEASDLLDAAFAREKVRA